jgi:flagellar motor component MotA
MKMVIEGLFVFLVVIVGSIACGPSVGFFVNFPSVIFVVGTAGGLALMKYKKGDGAVKFFKSSKKYLIIGGILGCMVGIVQMVSNCNGDSNTFNANNIFIGFGVCLLTTFYGLILYCIVDALTE